MKQIRQMGSCFLVASVLLEQEAGETAGPSCVDAAPCWPGLPFTWLFSSLKHFKVLTAYYRQKNSSRISRKLSKACFLSLSKSNFLEVNFLLLCFLRYFVSAITFLHNFIMLFLSLCIFSEIVKVVILAA